MATPDEEGQGPAAPTTMGLTKGMIPAQHEEQQGTEERKETIKQEGPSKLTPWAIIRGGEQPKDQGEKRPKTALKKMEDQHFS